MRQHNFRKILSMSYSVFQCLRPALEVLFPYWFNCESGTFGEIQDPDLHPVRIVVADLGSGIANIVTLYMIIFPALDILRKFGSFYRASD